MDTVRGYLQIYRRACFHSLQIPAAGVFDFKIYFSSLYTAGGVEYFTVLESRV